MKKKVRRLLLIDTYDIGAMESWLEDMARRGLILERISLGAVFLRSGPEERRYRIEPSLTSVYEREDCLEPKTDIQQELFEESGWTYVGAYADFCVYTAPDDADIPEPHGDPVTQGMVFARMVEKRRKSLRNWLFGIGAFLAFCLLYLFCTPYPLISLCSSISMSFIAGFLPPLLIAAYSCFSEWRRAKRLHVRALSGELLEHKRDYRAALRRGWIKLTGLPIWLALLLFCLLWKPENHKPPLDELPVLSLAEIEQTPDFTLEDYFDWEKYGLLAPVGQHDVLQFGYDANGEHVSLQTALYPLWVPSFAAPLLQELMHKHGETAIGTVSVPLYGSSFDEAYLSHTGTMQFLFMRKGDTVATVRYDGGKNLESFLPQIAEAMQK